MMPVTVTVGHHAAVPESPTSDAPFLCGGSFPAVDPSVARRVVPAAPAPSPVSIVLPGAILAPAADACWSRRCRTGGDSVSAGDAATVRPGSAGPPPRPPRGSRRGPPGPRPPAPPPPPPWRRAPPGGPGGGGRAGGGGGGGGGT